MRGFVVVAVVVASLAVVAQADKKGELMPKYIKNTLECVKEGNIDTNLCKEMMKDGNDNSQAKYEPCKCIIACVAKKAKVMNDAGEAELDKFTAAVDEFEIKEWSEEWKRVEPICVPGLKGKTGCVLGYDFFTCGYKESAIFRDVIKKFMGSVEGS